MTNHALISITENIRKALGNGKCAFGVFLDFQKAFRTVNHNILLAKHEHYGVRGIRKGSVLGPLLFFIFINDLHNAVKHTEVHHFADETRSNTPVNLQKVINNKINHDLKNIVEWVKANKIPLNASKTELVLFRTRSKMTKT